jgi:putative oxidoreductase
MESARVDSVENSSEVMMNRLQRYSDEAYALLRIVAGFLFAFHGMQKIFGVMSDHASPPMWTQVWVGGLIELVGGLMVGLGYKTRAAA